MSRLYLATQQDLTQSEMSLSLLGDATDAFLKSHEDLSTQAFIQVNFEAPLSRKALKSENSAWRSYPIALSCQNVQGAKNIILKPLLPILARAQLLQHYRVN